MGDRPVFRRALLKLSGEALMGEKSFGLDEKVVGAIADELREVVALGVKDARGVCRRHLIPQSLEHRHHAVDGPGRKTVGPRELGQGVQAPVRQIEAIDEEPLDSVISLTTRMV